MADSSLVRTALTVAMNVLFAFALLVTAGIIIEFFGALATTSWGEAIAGATEYFVLPIGVTSPRTPYGGVFDVDAAVTVVVLLLLEWTLSVVRSRA